MRKNGFFKPKHNKGYTLIEMLITIAIIVILLGISIIGIVGLRENLKMAELDDYAKIIYLEAQDQLGVVEVEGALGAYQKEVRNTYPASGSDKRFLKELYPLNTYVPDYPIADVGQELADKMWDNMCYLTKDDTLATKMISHTSDIYLNGGSYLIEFNPKTGDVYGVFYWESDTAISYDTNVLPLSSRERSARKASKIGYYGGAIAGDLEEEKNLGEKVTLVNGEELYLKISFKNTGELAAPFTNLKFNISITGEHNNTVTFDDVDLKSRNVDINHETIDFYMLLDSMYEDHQFNDIVNASKPEGEQVIVPGENITVKVETSFTDASGNVLKNANTVQGNSLFANATNDDQISISALRHMENMNRTFYDADKFANRNTVQYITDVDFMEDAYSWEINNYDRAIHIEYGTAIHPKDTITPIDNSTLFKRVIGGNRKVTGKNSTMKYVLRNFIVTPEGTQTENVGIFGEVYSIDFSNIYVENIEVRAANCDNVGSLIGYMENGSITECGAYLAISTDVGGVLADYAMMSDSVGSCHDNEMAHRYDTYRVKGKNNVGGLVGKVVSNSSVKIDKAFAAVKTEGANEYVGGLIGYAHIPSGGATFSIEHSYASGDAIGQGFVGGFAGGVVSNGTNTIKVTDNYSTGNVYGKQNFGGFLGKTQKAEYNDCISYGEVRKLGVADAEGHGLVVGDKVGGFVYESTATNSDSTYTDCVYMSQIGYNKSAALKNPTDIGVKEYSQLLFQNTDTAVAITYPYNEELYMQDFPFVKLDEQRTHYGDWPKKFVIDTSLVYYEKYADGSYGYYCVTTVAGNDLIWLLDTLKDETCVEDGYGLMTKYNLESISYDLYVGNQMKNGGPTASAEKVPIVYREDVEGKEYDEAFVFLNQQGRLTFEEIKSYDAVTGTEGEKTGESFEIKGLYLYQLPYDLQCTNRKNVPYFYDRIVFNATARGGVDKVVIEDLSYFYCPHFAKTAYNPNVSSDPIDVTQTNAVPNPVNVAVRSARQLNALGRFHYYWNTRHGFSGQQINYLQETDINFSTYAYDANTGKKIYAGKEFDLQAFDKPYSNRAIGNSELSVVGETDYAGAFKNNYNGQSHKIIDYCLDASDIQFAGLFGEIQGATLQNIVMVMSSEPASENAGLIRSDFKTWLTPGDDSRRREFRASVGALLGMAYDNTYCDDFSNTIDNCISAGYTVKFVVKDGVNPAIPEGSTDLDPLGIVIGGLIGYGESDITNCAAINDVQIELEDTDYTNNFSYWQYNANDNNHERLNHINEGGIVNMGGFVGSYIYNKIENCYSGGSIRVIDNGYTIPHLRVGNFCAGWLDTRANGLSYDDWKRAEKGERICSCGKWCSRNTTDFKAMEYVDCYTYTTVSDSIWGVSSKTMTYVPFASSKVDYFNRIQDKTPINGKMWVRYGAWLIGDAIPNNHTTYKNNYYIDMVAYTEKADQTQMHGSGVTCDQLASLAVDKATVNTTFVNADENAGKAYPYEAVVTDVNTGEYVHYGDWFTVDLPESVLTYYEKYADGSYGYYCVTATKDGEEAWVLDTLKDVVCVEDGYGLLSKHQLSTLSYTKGGNSSQCSLDRMNTKGPLRFKAYETYNEILGKGQGDLKESVNAANLYTYLYKLPYAVQDPGNPSSFFNEIVFNGAVGGAKVIDGFKAWYNPHFAKAALNPVKDKTYSTPTNVFVRSARQLNALGRNSYYWNKGKGGLEGVTFIQETDINFSTYTKTYMGQEFDLQAFGKTYSNQPIGRTSNAFKNIYDGRGNVIIDYCVDGGTSNGSTGLFGEVDTATLKNIVMTVSSNPKGNGGLITSSYLVPEGHSLYKGGIGTLFGMAIEAEGWNKSNNTITNCAVSGYTVQFLIKPEGRDAVGIAVGGLGGFSMSEITNCTAVNDVVLKLEKDYTNDALTNHQGMAYLGGFLGSQMYAPVRNSYSGGTIDVINNGDYRAPIIKVGGFCPGWLATNFGYEGTYGTDYANKEATNVKVEYEKIYAYTKVSDNVWKESYNTAYVPLVSKMVDWISGGKWNTVPLSEKVISFSNNIYLEEVTASHLEKTSDTVKAYYMKDGVNFTGMRKGLLGLGSYATDNESTVTVTEETTNTFVNGDMDSKGNLIPSKIAFPYPAVVQKVDAATGIQLNGFVHYGDWPNAVEKTLVYYEKYEDDTYGYYAVMSDIEVPKTWLLDTLKNKVCVEDGYAVLSEFELDSISYELKIGNQGDVISGKDKVEKKETQGNLVFKEYASYNGWKAELIGATGEKLPVSNLTYMYKIPYDDELNANRTSAESFYDRVVLRGITADGKEAFGGFYCRYNPHFAKAAINAVRGIEYSDPVNIYVRSARQLNALGRNPYYWNEFGGLARGEKVSFIQETDINFSTYTKNRDGKAFNLQLFGETYSNQPIGESSYSNTQGVHLTEAQKVAKHFRNIYDGRSHKIIDYCVDGGTNKQYVGLFGAVSGATLKNIVMVVSSEPTGQGGTITSKYESKHIWDNDWNYHGVGVGALVGLAYDNSDAQNTIQNCATSGYTVKYDLIKRSSLQQDLGPTINPNGGTMEPLAIAMGGFAGFSTSNIVNCTAVNDVVLELKKNYVHTHDNYLRHDKYTGGVAYLGGFAGSHANGKVDNCYSGGTIDVLNNIEYCVPALRIGGFCPGWLDTSIYEAGYKKNYNKITYSNIYSYTKIYQNVWDVPGKLGWNVVDESSGTGYFDYWTMERFNHFIPLVSTMVEYYDTVKVDNEFWVHDQAIPENKITFNKETNFYLEEVASAHVSKASPTVKNFYMENGVNKTAQKKTYGGLAQYATVYARKADTTYVKGDWDANGNVISSMKSYPYPAVIYNVNENGEKTDEYVHYGEWPSVIDSMFVYYEEYADESVGYYGVVEDPDSDAVWVVDTLRDEACIEDGYGIVSEFSFDKLSYDIYLANDTKTASKSYKYGQQDDAQVKEKLSFEIYSSYDEVNGVPKGEMIGEFELDNLRVLHKLPYDQQFTSRTTSQNFYDRIVFTATADEETVVNKLNCYYNPLFAKTAVTPRERQAYDNPTNIYIRSARQLNALGRNSYFWNETGYLKGASKVTFIQESDINFSTYVKTYMDRDFNLQAFGKSYSNHAIGESYGIPFTNIYDGRSNQIIDYCVDGGSNTQYVGLFGLVSDATLKNIVMVVSSEKSGNAGVITSKYITTHKRSTAANINDYGEAYIDQREAVAGVGALIGMAYETSDSGKNTIKNCVASGYTVTYELIAESRTYRPLGGSVNDDKNLLEPQGIAIGGLIGYSTSDVSNCAAVNKVVMELEKNYFNAFDSYINRPGSNKGDTGTGGYVYMGGFVGSHMYGQVNDCYSGGTIDVDNKGFSIPMLRVAGFCPGWLDTPMYETVFSEDQQVKYNNIYSYTEVSQSVWEVPGRTNWEVDSNKTFTHYVPLVSTLADLYSNTQDKEYWNFDQSVNVKNTTFGGNYYLQELSATHMKHVLTDGSDSPEKFYMVNSKDVTSSQITAKDLNAKATNKATTTYLNADTTATKAYPYQAVIKDVKTGKFVHYGTWYDGSGKDTKQVGNLMARYPAYYEEYADGSFGFAYLKEDGTRVDEFDKDPSKEIVGSGYGYLTIAPEDETEDKNRVNVQVNDVTYYLDKMTEGEIQERLNGNDSQQPCMKFNMTWNKATVGIEAGVGAEVKGPDVYINPKFGAALSATPDLGAKAENPLQVRTKEHFQNVGIAGQARYHKQTHDIDLAGGHTAPNVETGSYYDGSYSDLGCAIRNATTTVFGRNSGIIEDVRVASFDSSNSKDYSVAGFAMHNNGTIKNSTVQAVDEEDTIFIQAKNAYGFVETNNGGGTIENCSVAGTIKATESEAAGFAGTNQGNITKSFVAGTIKGIESAAGFVGKNVKSISYCTVVNANSDQKTVIEAKMAYGFAIENVTTIENCSVTSKVVGTDLAVGFIGANAGTISVSAVNLTNNDADAVIHGKEAYGFAAANSGTISSSKVEGYENGMKNGSIVGTTLATGFVGANAGTITDSYVRAMNSYEDVVIKGYDAYGFANENNGSITKCFVVGTVNAEHFSAGFVQSNNIAYGVTNCYSNANVTTSTTNKNAKASGFVHLSGDNNNDNKWIIYCYAAGTVTGYQTYDFAYSAGSDYCYTIVNQDENAGTLATLDNEATDTVAVPFNASLKGKLYPYATYGLKHYGDWPEPTRN